MSATPPPNSYIQNAIDPLTKTYLVVSFPAHQPPSIPQLENSPDSFWEFLSRIHANEFTHDFLLSLFPESMRECLTLTLLPTPRTYTALPHSLCFASATFHTPQLAIEALTYFETLPPLSLHSSAPQGEKDLPSPSQCCTAKVSLVFPSNKRDLFFPWLRPAQRALMQLDLEATWSVTDQITADVQSEILLSLVNPAYATPSSSNSPDVAVTPGVIDATACVGGNLMSFARCLPSNWTVVGVEIDKIRFDMLENNLKVIDVSHVRCICDDFTQLIGYTPSSSSSSTTSTTSSSSSSLSSSISPDLIQQPVVFFDPPWGGLNYRETTSIDLSLSEIPFIEICRTVHDKWPRLWLILIRLPNNFNLVPWEQWACEPDTSDRKPPILTRFQFPKQLLIGLVFDHSFEVKPSVAQLLTRVKTTNATHFKASIYDRDSHRWSPIYNPASNSRVVSSNKRDRTWNKDYHLKRHK